MIRSLQRRFVLTAMLSLFVLLVILISAISGASYIVMEKSTNQALEMFTSGMPPPAPENDKRLPFFGYQVVPNSPRFSNHSIVILSADRKILSVDNGFPSMYDDFEIQEYALNILEEGKEKGKIGSFKYALTELDNGNYRVTLLDVSVQAQTLADTIRVSSLVGLACMVMMFFILMLVSRRTVRPIANNMEKQRRFVTDAGHEIKTPLAIIQANVDAMELHLGENKWGKHIREQTMRLDGLMKQLLSLSQMDEESNVIRLENLDFSGLVNKCAELFSEANPEKQITSLVSPAVTLCGNEEGIEKLILILLDNAIKYSEVGTDIFVKLYSQGKKSVLEVINTCPELPDAEPQTLFDRFYRADNARTQKSGGYGIGLSIARAIVESHRGKITAHYDNNHTIRLRVEL